MKKFAVNLVTMASVNVVVEAEDAEAAIDLAFENAPSAAWDWPDMGEWALGSEMFPKLYSADDDVREVAS